VRFLCDQSRASNYGLPTPDDIAAVQSYLDTVRPVTVADLFVVPPILFGIAPRVLNLSNDSPSMRLAIAASVQAMLLHRAAPGQTIYAAWVSAAVSDAVGDGSFDLVFADAVMPSKGHMASLAASVGGGIAWS